MVRLSWAFRPASMMPGDRLGEPVLGRDGEASPPSRSAPRETRRPWQPSACKPEHFQNLRCLSLSRVIVVADFRPPCGVSGRIRPVSSTLATSPSPRVDQDQTRRVPKRLCGAPCQAALTPTKTDPDAQERRCRPTLLGRTDLGWKDTAHQGKQQAAFRLYLHLHHLRRQLCTFCVGSRTIRRDLADASLVAARPGAGTGASPGRTSNSSRNTYVQPA